MKLEEYLLSKHTILTARHYLYDINSYLGNYSASFTKKACYQDILAYIQILRKRYENPVMIMTKLMAVKKYYEWLCVTGVRNDNPAASVMLKDIRSCNIQIQDLFSPEELELLLKRKERFGILKNRNFIILSLLIYQGLKSGEICRLKLKAINWEESSITIKETTKTNGRILKLKNDQLNILRQYVNIDREMLIRQKKNKRKRINNNFLILNKTGKNERGEGISYLVSTFKNLFPDKKLNPKTIRQSVVANLLRKGADLRLVQVYAGHKYSGTTLKYRQTNIEGLRVAIDEFHPMK